MPAKLRVAELFAGAGGMALGLKRAGMETVWVAELADFPRRVLSHRFAGVPLYGDVAAIDGREAVASHGPLNMIAGGSPCQDLSVAGKRKGLDGERSGLFHEQMRLWFETGADLCLWENVAGALSSNDGKDFAAVLSAFVGAAVPVPRDGWTGPRCSGVVSGPAGVAAWRLLDAQYFGVPQRRLRVFVLGTRTGRIDPAQVLLEPQGVFGDSAPSRETREGSAADAGSGAVVPILEVGKRTGASTTDIRAGSGIGDEGDPMYTLQASAQHGVVAFSPLQGGRSMPVTEECPTLEAGSGNKAPAVLAFGWQNSQSQGDSVTDAIAPSLDKSKTPAVCTFAIGSHAGCADGEQTNESHASGGPVGMGISEEISHSLRADRTQSVVSVTGDVTHSLTHEGFDASEDGTGRGTPIIANAVCAREAKGWNPASSVGNGPVSNGIPRRLMPIECERLMSWEDGWTDVPDEKGKPASDSLRYKACGNGVVSNVAQWIGERIITAVNA